MEKFELYLFDESFQKKLWRRCITLTRNEADAQDLMQDTFLKAIDKKENFLRSERNKSDFDSLDVHRWVFTLCRNMFFDKMKKKTEILAGDDMPDISVSGEQEGAMIERDLRYCLETLNDEERQVILMLPDSEYQEIADSMGLSYGNVRVKIHRAREKLSSCMELAA